MCGSGSAGDLISPFTSQDIFTSFIFLWEDGRGALREVRSVRLYEVNFGSEVWFLLLDLVNFE